MFGDKLRKHRKAAGLTQKKFGFMIGTGESTVSEWESGKRSPDIEKLPEIAQALGVSPADLLSNDGELSAATYWYTPLVDAYSTSPDFTQRGVCKLLDIEHIKPKSIARKKIRRRVYDDATAAGEPLYAESSYTEMEFPVDEVPSSANYGVWICGDSMEPTIPNGSIAWVESAQEAHDGDIVIAWLDGDGTVCKRFTYDDDGYPALMSDNPSGPEFHGAELRDMRIYGRVVGHTVPEA